MVAAAASGDGGGWRWWRLRCAPCGGRSEARSRCTSPTASTRTPDESPPSRPQSTTLIKESPLLNFVQVWACVVHHVLNSSLTQGAGVLEGLGQGVPADAHVLQPRRAHLPLPHAVDQLQPRRRARPLQDTIVRQSVCLCGRHHHHAHPQKEGQHQGVLWEMLYT